MKAESATCNMCEDFKICARLTHLSGVVRFICKECSFEAANAWPGTWFALNTEPLPTRAALNGDIPDGYLPPEPKTPVMEQPDKKPDICLRCYTDSYDFEHSCDRSGERGAYSTNK